MERHRTAVVVGNDPPGIGRGNRRILQRFGIIPYLKHNLVGDKTFLHQFQRHSIDHLQSHVAGLGSLIWS